MKLATSIDTTLSNHTVQTCTDADSSDECALFVFQAWSGGNQLHACFSGGCDRFTEHNGHGIIDWLVCITVGLLVMGLLKDFPWLPVLGSMGANGFCVSLLVCLS